jgi:hypothetical protein
MEFTRIKEIREGDTIECLTEDGWECGTATKVEPDKITAFMDYIGEEREFEIGLIKF